MKKRQIQRGFTSKFVDYYARGDVSFIHRLRCNIKLVSHLIQHAITPGFSINFDKEFSQISTVLIDFLRVYPKLVKSMNKESDVWHISHQTVLFLLMELIHMLEVCQKSIEMPKPKSRKNSTRENEAKKQKKLKEAAKNLADTKKKVVSSICCYFSNHAIFTEKGLDCTTYRLAGFSYELFCRLIKENEEIKRMFIEKDFMKTILSIQISVEKDDVHRPSPDKDINYSGMRSFFALVDTLLYKTELVELQIEQDIRYFFHF